MNKNEFTYTAANVFALANQRLGKKWIEMQQEMGADSHEDLTGFPQSLSDHREIRDFLDAGYQAMKEMQERAEQAYKNNDTNILAELLQAFPAEFPSLKKSLTAEEFSSALDFVTQEHEVDMFSLVHTHFIQLFNQEIDGPHRDAIREAIADEDVSKLQALADKIQPTDIIFDDVQTALMLEAFDVFEWLYHRSCLTDEDILSLVEYASSDLDFFERLFNIIKPDMRLLAKIRAKVESLNEPDISAFLSQAAP